MAEYVFRFHAGRQPTGCDDLQPIVIDMHLHICGGTVIPVGDGVYQRLARGIIWQLQPLIQPLAWGMSAVLNLDCM